ncbi:hypothetical protein B0H11DRAFT_1920387 [Mycena galericulata]|nr:hypothetical protein B0H11DRAFT_1920387 [Mycena galericulata]
MAASVSFPAINTPTTTTSSDYHDRDARSDSSRLTYCMICPKSLPLLAVLNDRANVDTLQKYVKHSALSESRSEPSTRFKSTNADFNLLPVYSQHSKATTLRNLNQYPSAFWRSVILESDYAYTAFPSALDLSVANGRADAYVEQKTYVALFRLPIRAVRRRDVDLCLPSTQDYYRATQDYHLHIIFIFIFTSISQSPWLILQSTHSERPGQGRVQSKSKHPPATQPEPEFVQSFLRLCPNCLFTNPNLNQPKITGLSLRSP